MQQILQCNLNFLGGPDNMPPSSIIAQLSWPHAPFYYLLVVFSELLPIGSILQITTNK